MKRDLLTDALDFLDDEMLDAAAVLRMKPPRKVSLRRVCAICVPAAACVFLLLTAGLVSNLRCGSAGEGRPGSAQSGSESSPGTEPGGNGIQSTGGSDFEGSSDGLTFAESGDAEAQPAVFEGLILEIREDSILVEPAPDSTERRSSDKIVVSTRLPDGAGLPELSVGQTVRIVYDGRIQETYPAGIPGVLGIYDAEESTPDGGTP